METINFKNLLEYMNEQELGEAIADTPFALASAIIDQLGLLPSYFNCKRSHNVDDNYSWEVYELDGKYLELHSSIGGSFVSLYNSLDEIESINGNWLEYDEENDDFNVIENEGN